jgi:hypothetical protein
MKMGNDLKILTLTKFLGLITFFITETMLCFGFYIAYQLKVVSDITDIASYQFFVFGIVWGVKSLRDNIKSKMDMVSNKK